jgi:hypothetical protein
MTKARETRYHHGIRISKSGKNKKVALISTKISGTVYDNRTFQILACVTSIMPFDKKEQMLHNLGKATNYKMCPLT